RAKQAGYDGSKLRVSISPTGAPASEKAPERKPASKAKDGAPESPAADASAQPPATAASGPATFNVTVEREKPTGGWKVEEAVKDAMLTEVETEDGAKRIAVAYKDNKAPQLVDILSPESGGTLANLFPREQQQSLNIEQN